MSEQTYLTMEIGGSPTAGSGRQYETGEEKVEDKGTTAMQLKSISLPTHETIQREDGIIFITGVSTANLDNRQNIKSIAELRSKLNLSTGSLYHNLGFLSDYIEREGKKYKLNSAGMELYSYVRQPMSRAETVAVYIVASVGIVFTVYGLMSGVWMGVVGGVTLLMTVAAGLNEVSKLRKKVFEQLERSSK
jgi:hypothetical protein